MVEDDDYDDEIRLEPEPTTWDPLEWEDLRASRRFAAFVKLARRARQRADYQPTERPNEVDWLTELANRHPDLWEYHEDRIWFLIDLLRLGREPKPAKLTKWAHKRRAAAIERQRARRGQ